MVSRYNSSNLNIKNGLTFEGKFEDVSNYGSVNISLNTDVKFVLNIYWSSNGISSDSNETITQSTTPSETLYYQRNIKEKYFKLVLLNDDSITSEKLFLQTIYKSFALSSGGGSGGDVSIISPLTGGAVSIVGSVSVSNLPSEQDVNITNASLAITGSVDVNNFPASVAVTNADITNIYNIVNSRGSGTLWAGSATGAGGVSLAINLTSKNIKNISFMGNCDASTLLTVQFSNDGTTYYDSQYSFNLSSSGDVGFNLSCCPNYLRVKSSNNVTASLYANYC